MLLLLYIMHLNLHHSKSYEIQKLYMKYRTVCFCAWSNIYLWKKIYAEFLLQKG